MRPDLPPGFLEHTVAHELAHAACGHTVKDPELLERRPIAEYTREERAEAKLRAWGFECNEQFGHIPAALWRG